MKTIVAVAIAILCASGVLAAVFVLGGEYQQDLFEDYMGDSIEKNPQRQPSDIDLPSIDLP